MEELSLLEKFSVLFDNVFEHPLFIILLLVPAIMFLLQKKHGKKGFIFVYLLVILFVLYIGGEVIFELFDNLMNGLFMTLYFPNFITLFIVVVLSSIIALVSFFSKKMYKLNKIINITGFAITQMLFVLTLTVIRSKNIDIYADNALYSNSDILSLMQILIGAFALQMTIIIIINAINKVTDILDKRSTPLASEISEEITNLEKTKNNLSLIKNIEIDNSKVGYINVADKKKTSKPLLKPFKFDVEKIESITLNVKEDHKPTFDEMFGPALETPSNEIVFDRVTLDEPKIVIEKPIEKVIEKPIEKETVSPKTKEVMSSLKNKVNKIHKKIKPLKKKNVLLPKEKSIPINLEKPDLLKPMGMTFQPVSPNLKKGGSSRFIKNPDLTYDNLKIVGDVDKTKLVREKENVDLVDNLKIIDIQSTLDTVIKFRLMKGVNLKVVEDNDLAVDNLQIPDFDKMMNVLNRCKLYKKIKN